MGLLVLDENFREHVFHVFQKGFGFYLDLLANVISDFLA